MSDKDLPSQNSRAWYSNWGSLAVAVQSTVLAHDAVYDGEVGMGHISSVGGV